MAKKKTREFDLNFGGGENWLNRTWRPMAAVVYLLICIFDFIVAPAFMGFKGANLVQLAQSLKGLDPAIAVAIIQNRTPWQPLTLQGSGLFHVAFGAILGVAAWTRGSAQIEQIKQAGESDRSPNTPVMVPTYYLPAAPGAAPTPMGVPATPVTPTPQMSVTVNGGTVGTDPNAGATTNPDNPDA